VRGGKTWEHALRAATHSSDFKALLGFNPVTFTKGQNAMTLSCRICMREVLKLQIKHRLFCTGRGWEAVGGILNCCMLWPYCQTWCLIVVKRHITHVPYWTGFRMRPRFKDFFFLLQFWLLTFSARIGGAVLNVWYELYIFRILFQFHVESVCDIMMNCGTTRC
jgi:hypothetical protein